MVKEYFFPLVSQAKLCAVGMPKAAGALLQYAKVRHESQTKFYLCQKMYSACGALNKLMHFKRITHEDLEVNPQHLGKFYDFFCNKVLF